MKRIIVYFLAIIFVTQIFANNAFYVYRNDGSFNAFNFYEIDSICYSSIDIDSIQHDVIVTKNIYTADSIYRIPISVIDSVAFAPLENKFKSNVIKIDEWIPYLTKVDTTQLAISFSALMPFKANKGDVLYYEMFNEQFPIGFAGKIAKIIEDEDITFVCDSVSIDDVFEQIFYFGNYVISEDSIKNNEGEIKQKIVIGGSINGAVEYPLWHSEEKSLIKGAIKAAMSAKVLLKKRWGEPMYLSAKIGGEISLNVNLEVEEDLIKFQYPNEGNIGKFMSKPLVDLPIPNCPMVRFRMRAVPLIKGSGKSKLNVGVQGEANASYEFELKDDTFKHIPKSSASASFNAEFGLEGSIFGGVRLYPYLTCVGEMFTVAVKLDVGPRLNGNFMIDADAAMTDGIYESIKDSKANLQVGAFLSAETKLKKSEPKLSGELALFTEIIDAYLLPEFTKPEVKNILNWSSVEISSNPSRDLFVPVKVGLGIHDELGNLIDAKYCANSYWTEDGWKDNNVLKQQFEGLSIDKNYQVYPYVKILGCDIKASPGANVNVPVEIENVEVTKASYYPSYYIYNGEKYSFKYNCTTYIKLRDNTNVDDWGYVYVDSNDNISDLISLKGYNGIVGDPRYAYYKNDIAGTIKLKGYIKYVDEENVRYGEIQEFQIKYPEETSIAMTDCTYQGTANNATYQGKVYKYKTTYRYLFKANGAYWLNVGTDEFGSGWNNWNNLSNDTVSPIDGLNALTINYYYDDKEFSGDYNVYLKAKDETHLIEYNTSEYVTYTHSGNIFTGCTFFPATDGVNISTKQQETNELELNAPIHNIVINKCF